VLFGLSLAQTEVWVATYSGIGYQNDAQAIALTRDSCVVITGFSVGPDMSRDLVTVKLRRESGQEVWATRWVRGVNTREEGRAIAVDDSNYTFVCGPVWAVTTDTDFVTIKYKPNGDTAWVRYYNNNGVDVASSLVPDGRGGVFVTGRSNAGAGNANQDYLTIHYDAQGVQKWAARLAGAANWHDVPTAICLDKSGKLYVTGYSWTGATPQYDFCTVKYDTALGDTVWVRRYDGTASAPKADYALACCLDDSGYLYVTGRAGEQGTWYDATTVKYSPDGTTVWVNRFDAGWLGSDGGGNVATDRNYNVYVGGIVKDPVDDMYDFLTFKITPGNQVAWYRTYDGRVEDDDSLTSMVVDDRGNVYVTGWSYVYQGDIDWMTMKYSPDGVKLWSSSHATFGEDDWPFGMVMDEYGEVYVTGFDYSGPDENYCVVKYTEDDVGAFRIVLPDDTFRVGATVTPRAWVRNYSALTSRAFSCRLEIGGFYFDARMVDTIPAYDSALVTFSPWQVERTALGTHQARCYTMLDVDKEVTNDTAYTSVAGVEVWQRMADVPVGSNNRAVKDGGALGFVPDSFVFAFKGNNTIEFYAYDVRKDSWFAKETIPSLGTSGKKRVKGGSRLAYDGSRNLYAFKGNNTIEFWKYDVPNNRWAQDMDYPFGGSNRKVKSGASLMYVPGKMAFYSAKANNTFEFYAYDVVTSTWIPKSSIPGGLGGKKPKDGSAAAFDGDNTIYLLKGGTYEFYAYKISADSWYQQKDIRNSMYVPKKRKMKKGAAAAFDTLYNKLYVLKGGKSGELWFFDVARDSWTEWPDDSFPTPAGTRVPYAGSDMCYANGKLYALRGNKTLEFWRYNSDLPLRRDTWIFGPQAAPAPPAALRLRASPNPFNGRAMLRYSLPGPGRVRLVIYDATGRLARALVDEWQPGGERLVALKSEGLAAGVYVARLQVSGAVRGQETTTKLLITK
jgi:hypothetical protein